MLIGEWKLSGEFCFKAGLLSTFRKPFKMNDLIVGKIGSALQQGPAFLPNRGSSDCRLYISLHSEYEYPAY